MLTGWLNLNGKYYYLNPSDSGKMAANKTLTIDGVSYSFGSDGAYIANGNSSSPNTTTTTPGNSCATTVVSGGTTGPGGSSSSGSSGSSSYSNLTPGQTGGPR